MTSIVADGPPRTAARIAGTSPRIAGRIAGWGILALALIAAFSEFYVRQRLVVPGDATATAANITANELLMRLGILGFVVVIILDVVVAVALHALFKPVNSSVSGLMALSRIVFATIFAVAVANLITALHLVSAASYLAALPADQLHAQMMLSLNAFSSTWSVGLAFFGIHLSLAGYLAYRSGYMPKALGIILVIAGLGYAADSFIGFVVPDYEAIAALFTFVGEVALFLWLLIRSAKIPDAP
jgi:hypothetical protein